MQGATPLAMSKTSLLCKSLAYFKATYQPREVDPSSLSSFSLSGVQFQISLGTLLRFQTVSQKLLQGKVKGTIKVLSGLLQVHTQAKLTYSFSSFHNDTINKAKKFLFSSNPLYYVVL